LREWGHSFKMLFKRVLDKTLSNIQLKGLSMSESGLQALRQEHDEFFREYWLDNFGILPTQDQLAGLWCENMQNFYYMDFEEFAQRWLDKWQRVTSDFLPSGFILN